jgi:hypothetical protein
MRYLEVVEEHETVVHGVVAHLRSHVANVNTLQWQMRLHISNLHDERMRTVVLAVDYQLCHNNRMVRCPS